MPELATTIRTMIDEGAAASPRAGILVSARGAEHLGRAVGRNDAVQACSTRDRSPGPAGAPF